MLAFVEGGNPGTPAKIPRSRDENQQQTQPTYCRQLRDSNPGHKDRMWALSPLIRHPCSCAWLLVIPKKLSCSVKIAAHEGTSCREKSPIMLIWRFWSRGQSDLVSSFATGCRPEQSQKEPVHTRRQAEFERTSPLVQFNWSNSWDKSQGFFWRNRVQIVTL